MNAVEIVATTFVRERYVMDRHHFLIRVLAAVFLLTALSVTATVRLMNRGEVSLYIPIEKDDTFTRYKPLNMPNESDAAVANWVADAVLSAYRFDFLNYRTQLQKTQLDMTLAGWENFRDALIQSANIKTIKQMMLVSTPKLRGAPSLVKKGVFNGRYAWKFIVPIHVDYQSSEQTMSQNLDVTVVVVRHPEYLNPAGLAMAQIIAK